MADIAELGYKVDSSELSQSEKLLDKNTDAAKKTEKASARLERQYRLTEKQAKRLGVALGAIGLALVYGVIRNTIEAEKVQAQLAAALNSTGGAAGQSIKMLNDHAAALQNVTAYGDETINTAQGILLTFTKIQGDTFPKATEAVLDMATALQMDLKSSAIQVGKALNDPILGVTALGRAGVQFSEDQKAMIKALVDTGRTAEAQEIILRELETQFGGSARAARDTLGGALQALKNAFGDLLEGDSGGDGVRGTKRAIEDLTAVLQSEGVKEGFQTIIQSAATATVKFAEMLAGAANLTRFMAEEFAARTGGIGGDDIARLEAKAQELRGRLEKQRDRFVLIDIGGAEAKLETELASVENEIKSFYERTAQAAEAAQAKTTGTTSPGGGAVTDRISAQAQQMVDKLREEAEAYGLSRSALLEREKAQAVAAATNDLERQALEESYDALIAVVRADEQAKGSKTALAKANREAERAEREAAQAVQDYTRATEDLRAELEGPVAQVRLDYERKERELLALADLAKLSDLERAETLALLTQARERDIRAAELQAKLEAEQLGPREQLFADLDRHIELMKMSRIERETEIALERVLLDLRRQGIELTPEQIEADRQRISSKLEEIDAIDKQIAAMDEFRSSFSSNVADVLTGSKSAKDAIADLVDDFIAQMARLASQRFTESLFGAQGTTGGGLFGGSGWGSFFASIFGSGRDLGGYMRGNQMHQVGERDRPELANIGGKQYLIPGDRGTVEPLGNTNQRPAPVQRGGDLHVHVQGKVSNRAIQRIDMQHGQRQRAAQRNFG